ncbi:hypothetical protein [Microbacterium sp. 22296]|uniref:hypothetical protein n=1 Tax=Microbacterium sp. 22296 TaxID=3453903 RepID=UPI003F86FE42
MFAETDPVVLLLEFLGVVLIIALSVVAHRLAARVPDPRWRRPWWAVIAVVVVGVVIHTQIDGLVSASRSWQKLSAEVGFPAEYVHDGSRLTLAEDGTATLRSVVLADGVTKNAEGRWCLEGVPTPVTGEGRWSMDAAGFVRVEADGKLARLHADDGLLGYGWLVTHLLTMCDVEFAAEYLPAPAR